MFIRPGSPGGRIEAAPACVYFGRFNKTISSQSPPKPRPLVPLTPRAIRYGAKSALKRNVPRTATQLTIFGEYLDFLAAVKTALSMAALPLDL